MGVPIRIFLDDERNHPLGEEWTVVRTVEDLLHLVDAQDANIVEISFDNDLQLPLEGRHGLRAILERRLDDHDRLPALRRITIHSANNVAAEAMVGEVEGWLRHGIFTDVAIRRRPPEGRLYPLAADDDRTSIVPYVRPS